MLELIIRNKIAVGGLAFVIAVVAWYVLRDAGGAQENFLLTENVAEGTEADRDLVATLLQLRTVSLSGTIFSDPIFQTLQDFGSQIIPEPVGRPNPFAPLGGGGPPPSTGTSTATSSAQQPSAGPPQRQ
jgi:hypothetical protein